MSARVATLVCAGLLVGPCDLAAQPPCPPIAATGDFRAGFGRADITPPPGAGLLGYGPDSRRARGFRQRLMARAMALEDGRGERIVVAVADLDFISGALQRAVVARVKACTGIGADRLLLSATHTHAGPGNFSGISATDEFGTGVRGFDPGLQAYLAERIGNAIVEAVDRMRPARAAWGERPVWGLTRIRAWAAHQADPHDLPSRYQPASAIRGTPLGEVDPTLTIFRVDTAAGADRFAPAGAWAHYAIHGTSIPAPNDVYDADLHGAAARVLEAGGDSLLGRKTGGQPAFIAMFANGAQGDVRPESRVLDRECASPVLRRELRPGGWRTPPGGDVWLDRPGFDAGACVTAGLEDTRILGDRLGHEALDLFASLTDSLRGDPVVARMFQQVPLVGPDAPPGLCERGRPGMSQFAGADTRETRFQGFRWLGIFPAGIEEGGTAIHPTGACLSPKRTIPAFVEKVLIGAHGFEEAAQFLVVRLGSTVLGAVPFEPTTTLGARMREAMLEAASGSNPPVRALVVGLANNYVNYVTTRLEYGQQSYEGGSTLYGPGSGEVYTEQLRKATAALAAAGWRSPPDLATAFPIFPGASRPVVRFQSGPLPPYAPVLRSVRVGSSDVLLHWEDDDPGWLIPLRPGLVVVEREGPSGWTPVARDGTLDIEVRVLKRKGNRAVWEARWIGVPEPGTRYRFRVPDPGQPAWGVTMEFGR